MSARICELLLKRKRRDIFDVERVIGEDGEGEIKVKEIAGERKRKKLVGFKSEIRQEIARDKETTREREKERDRNIGEIRSDNEKRRRGRENCKNSIQRHKYFTL